MSCKTKIQLIEKEIKTQNSLVRISEELDYNYKKLVGIAVLNNIGKHHEFTSFNIDGNEVFPKNFEVAFLQTNSHVSPKDRFFPLDRIANGKKIEIEFKDINNTTDNLISPIDIIGAKTEATASKYPYTLKIYLLLSDDE